MLSRLFVKPFILVVAFVIGGCFSSVNTVQREVPRAEPTLAADRRIVTDYTLIRKIELVGINETRVSGDLLRVDATLRNLTRRPQSVAYKVDFIAVDGTELAAPGAGWKRMQLEGGEERALTAVAASPRAVDFRLKLRE